MGNAVHFYTIGIKVEGKELKIITLPKGGNGADTVCAYGTDERMFELTRRQIADAMVAWRGDGIKIVRN